MPRTETATRDPSPRSRSARANLVSLFNSDDYPLDALRNEEQGTVTVELQVGTTGRVSSCTVMASSGSNSLDRTTCEILQGRARFAPATDSSGTPVTDVYTQRITWRLE